MKSCLIDVNQTESESILHVLRIAIPVEWRISMKLWYMQRKPGSFDWENSGEDKSKYCIDFGVIASEINSHSVMFDPMDCSTPGFPVHH